MPHQALRWYEGARRRSSVRKMRLQVDQYGLIRHCRHISSDTAEAPLGANRRKRISQRLAWDHHQTCKGLTQFKDQKERRGCR
jgi:hypothetical protein